MKNKQCGICKEIKQINMFHRHKNTSDGRQSCCSECTRAANRQYNGAKLERKKRKAELEAREKPKIVTRKGIKVKIYPEAKTARRSAYYCGFERN